MVLPKLREEKERIRKKSKKKSIKDVIVSGMCVEIYFCLSVADIT